MIRHYSFQQLAGGNCGNCFRNLISLTTPDMCVIFQHHLLSVFELTCGRFGFVRCRREKDGAPQVGGKVRPILNPIADGDEVRVSDDV